MLLGWILLPVFDTALAFVVYLVMFADGTDGHARFDPVDAAGGFAGGVAFIAVPMMALGAVPATLLLLWRGRTSPAAFAIVGTLLGHVPYALAVGVNLLLDLTYETTSNVDYILWTGPMRLAHGLPIGCIVGCASGMFFWLVAIAGGTAKRDGTTQVNETWLFP